MPTPQLALTARLHYSALEARRGIVRAHPEALAALGLREWDGVSVIGARSTAAVIAATAADAPTGIALLDELTLSNAGVAENAQVVLAPAAVYAASVVRVAGSRLSHESLDETTLRRALLGKVVTPGDVVSLLPRDLGPGTSTSEATRALARAVGITWTNELLTITAVEVAGASPQAVGPVSVQPNTAVLWADDSGSADPGSASQAAGAPAAGVFGVTVTRPAAKPASNATVDLTPANAARAQPAANTPVAPPPAPPAVPKVDDLVGVDEQARKLAEWLRLTLDTPELLTALGARPRLGVLVTGPAGAGKTTFVRAVTTERTLVVVDGPVVGALAGADRIAAVTAALGQAAGGVLLITDIDALLPADPDPATTLLLDALRGPIGAGTTVLIATSSEPDRLDQRLRDPDLCDRILTFGLPDARLRRRLLEALLRKVPTGDLDLTAIAERTPGFVVADLAALCREGALRAAARAAADSAPPRLTQDDLAQALSVIRPVSRSGSPEPSLGGITLDDVGDMVETKQALTEAVLWPLQHPDTFARLGVDPPRGVLLYGPPGCGKTFLVRALAASGRLSVHVVKGSELMDKWVGSSEKAIRDLFSRARESAPSLIFLDEIDALAPRRGQSQDSGVGDKVVAALLTELDGAEPLRDVVVLGATNRPDLIDPALLRPGRLERIVFVPPPDADARRAILETSGRSVPLADDVDLGALATDLDGYSAADCSALLREAALAAMRRDIDAAVVTADDVASARKAVRPSLDPGQVADLQAYADRRSGGS